MSIPQRLAVKLDETLGREAAEDIVTVFEEIRAELNGTRADLGELRNDMGIGFEKIERRLSQLDMRFAEVRAETKALIEGGLREQTRFFFAAWAFILATIVGLYAR